MLTKLQISKTVVGYFPPQVWAQIGGQLDSQVCSQTYPVVSGQICDNSNWQVDEQLFRQTFEQIQWWVRNSVCSQLWENA